VSKYYSQRNFETALKFEAQIENLELELLNDENQPFYDEDKKRFISYAEFVMNLEEKYKQTIFDIKESTGDGNYTDVEKWNFTKISDYLKRKEKQIKKIQAQYKRK